MKSPAGLQNLCRAVFQEREAAAILGILPPQCKVYHTRYNIPSAILIISSAGGKLKEMQVIFYEK